jgi:hypothetical protein
MKANFLVRRNITDVLADLPKVCAAHSPGDNAPILIRRGERGYFPAPGIDVDAFNARHGVTEAQREAMLAGSMFGFDCPGADPLNN